MTFRTLINTDALAKNIQNKDWVIIDCRFSLADPDAGIKAYRKNHIPNARYADLDKDLSSAVTESTGRHPLPDFSRFTRKLGQWGISNHSQVVVYDDAGAAFAGRLWWLLHCLGHNNVAVLDGGIKHWQQQHRVLTTTIPVTDKKSFRPYLNNSLWLSTETVQEHLENESITLLDARSAERYNGEHEPIDPVAGHIPGALNRDFQLNLDHQGLFLKAGKLREQFCSLIGDRPAEKIVHMCGSGVTACHNLLAMEIAGLSGSKLYPGSWSEWITDKSRAIATKAISSAE